MKTAETHSGRWKGWILLIAPCRSLRPRERSLGPLSPCAQLRLSHTRVCLRLRLNVGEKQKAPLRSHSLLSIHGDQPVHFQVAALVYTERHCHPCTQ